MDFLLGKISLSSWQEKTYSIMIQHFDDIFRGFIEKCKNISQQDRDTMVGFYKAVNETKISGAPHVFMVDVKGEHTEDGSDHMIALVIIPNAKDVSKGTLSIVSRWHLDQDIYGDIPGITQYGLVGIVNASQSFLDCAIQKDRATGYRIVTRKQLLEFISKIVPNKIGVIPMGTQQSTNCYLASMYGATLAIFNHFAKTEEEGYDLYKKFTEFLKEQALEDMIQKYGLDKEGAKVLGAPVMRPVLGIIYHKMRLLSDGKLANSERRIQHAKKIMARINQCGGIKEGEKELSDGIKRIRRLAREDKRKKGQMIPCAKGSSANLSGDKNNTSGTRCNIF